MIIAVICAPIFIIALLTGFSGLPLAYALLAVADLWQRLKATGSLYAYPITALAALLWLCLVTTVAYLLLSSGWQHALRL